jgi:hypothetical protein
LNTIIRKAVQQVINQLRSGKADPPGSAPPKRNQIWSIGIFVGESPFVLSPALNVDNPVLTGDSVSDVPACFVADPFMLKVKGTWYMFFEVMNLRSGKGEIGLAVSQDGLQWKYHQIVLTEPFHLSYPYVFEYDSQYYMVPESHRANSVRLYRAVHFPTRWSYVGDLLTGGEFMDSSVFLFNDRWWLLTDRGGPPNYAGILHLFSAADLMGPWAEHPKSPVIYAEPHIARPAGRVLVTGDSVIRYTQDCAPIYGAEVRAFEITKLTTMDYQERHVPQNPVLVAGGAGWNESGMHHVDPHILDDGRWLACVDGFIWQESRS